MSWKAKIAGMTGRATMISVIADEVSERKSQGGGARSQKRREEARARERHTRTETDRPRATLSVLAPCALMMARARAAVPCHFY